MPKSSRDKQQKLIETFFERGIDTIYPSEKAFRKLLESGKQCRFYLGADPSRPDLHIGHAVLLRRMRVLQQLGHEIIFLIGDFTGRIGDPTDRSAARSQMTEAEVKQNARTYQQQIRKVLDFEGDNPARITFNATWLKKLKFEDLVNLSAHFTVQQMIERDMYQARLSEGKPIYLHEFFYPLMQGYDSVAMEVDGEFGGSDQLFNMMTGRHLLKSIKGTEKFVITGQLLLGTDGRKMSKSYDNYIGLSDAPEQMYGKIMSIRDELISDYYTLCTDMPVEQVKTIRHELKTGKQHPRDVKMALARQITEEYCGKEEAMKAEQAFVHQFQGGGMPAEIPAVEVPQSTLPLLDALVVAKLATSRGDAKRLLRQGAVKINGEKILPDALELNLDTTSQPVLQTGKLNFRKILHRSPK